MMLFETYYLLIFMSITVVTSKGVPRYAKQGCNDNCGNISIPYPFGIGTNCAINELYVVDCNSSKPYLPAVQNFEIIGISLINQTITVNTPKPIFSDCQNPVMNISQMNNIDVSRTPFLVSSRHNIFVSEGCGNAFLIDHENTVLTGCSTTCFTNSTFGDDNNCFGVSCCRREIPRSLQSYSISITGLERQGGDRGCGSAFVMDTSSYINRNFSNSQSIPREENFVPITFVWTLSAHDNDQVFCCPFNSKDKLRVYLDNHTTVDSWRCMHYAYYEGNVYLHDGCTVVPQPTYTDSDCSRCTESGGSCNLGDTIYDIDGRIFEQNTTCNYDKPGKSILGVILGVSISIGILFLVAISYALYILFRKTKDKRQRKRFFKRNGGILLKQQAEADPSLVDKTILFTSRVLAKATDNFNENRILGRGGQGTVYKGMLADGRIVAVKKSKIVDESQLTQFINEVVILSQVNHRNVVRLLG